MPVFGARMVCEAGHYKLARERSRAELERETNLGKWVPLTQLIRVEEVSEMMILLRFTFQVGFWKITTESSFERTWGADETRW